VKEPLSTFASLGFPPSGLWNRRQTEREIGSGSCGTPVLSSRLPSGWPSFGSHPLRLSGGGTSATDARKAPDPHKCFLCVRGIPHVSAPARASLRGAESSHKNPLCSFGGGGSNPAFLASTRHGSFLARAFPVRTVLARLVPP